jgi:hypothetical protein
MMKKNAKNSALGKLSLRRETIQQLGLAQLGDVGGAAAPTDGQPRSHYMSCVNTNCTSYGSFFDC